MSLNLSLVFFLFCFPERRLLNPLNCGKIFLSEEWQHLNSTQKSPEILGEGRKLCLTLVSAGGAQPGRNGAHRV